MSRSPRLIHINSKRLRVETLGTVSKCWWFQSRLARVGKFLRATATMGACCEKRKTSWYKESAAQISDTLELEWRLANITVGAHI